jgi:hypothetical protein
MMKEKRNLDEDSGNGRNNSREGKKTVSRLSTDDSLLLSCFFFLLTKYPQSLQSFPGKVSLSYAALMINTSLFSVSHNIHTHFFLPIPSSTSRPFSFFSFFFLVHRLEFGVITDHGSGGREMKQSGGSCVFM